VDLQIARASAISTAALQKSARLFHNLGFENSLALTLPGNERHRVHRATLSCYDPLRIRIPCSIEQLLLGIRVLALRGLLASQRNLPDQKEHATYRGE